MNILARGDACSETSVLCRLMLRIAVWVEVMACWAEELGPPLDTASPSVEGPSPCSPRECWLLVFTAHRLSVLPHKTFDLGASLSVLASSSLAPHPLPHFPPGQQDEHLDS